MLETVVQAAQAKHFDIIACPNPDRPRELHHVLIPEKGLAFITTNARNPYALSDAKKAHDALESAYHPCMDFDGDTALAEKEIKRLLKQ